MESKQENPRIKLRGFNRENPSLNHPDMTEPEPATVRVVDVTPTWSETLRLLLIILENGTEEGKEIARKELARMAQAADNWNAANGQ